MQSESRKVANKKDIQEGGLLRIELDGKPIVLAMVEGKVYAIDAVCTHQGGPLDEGKLEGHNLTCPWHYAVFDVRNGRVSDKTVWATNVGSYPVKVDESTGDVTLSLQPAHEVPMQKEETLQQKRPEENNNQAMEQDRKFYEEEERKASDKLSLQLLEKEKLQGTDIMTFKLSRGGLDYAPGQFAYFKLEQVRGDPKGDIRHFSIASSPTEQDYLMISTRIRDTPYKQKLASLDIGTSIVAWGPQGEFVLQEDKPTVFLSGGIGVTPFRNMLKYATDKSLPTKIVVFDSNRNVDNILYKKEFDSWARKNPNLRIIYTVTDEKGQAEGQWEGERGRIDRDMLKKNLTDDELTNSIFYVCGPPGMLKAMQGLLKELQIPKQRIKVEEFTGY